MSTGSRWTPALRADASALPAHGRAVPTLLVPQLGFDKTRGFQVINRPWTLSELIKQPAFATRIQEEYVYIAETDHLLLKAPPNRATPQLNVAFFFPYMSPVPSQQASVVKRYYQGNHLDVQPVGGSPAIMHTATLKKLAPVWFDLSVKLKADRDADRIFGWVLEMWGYSIACAQLGIKQFVWQKLQIEPSAAWHQEVSAQARRGRSCPAQRQDAPRGNRPPRPPPVTGPVHLPLHLRRRVHARGRAGGGRRRRVVSGQA